MNEVTFLLWSGKHRMWWRPDAMGYTDNIDEAGRYGAVDAILHVLGSAYCGVLDQVTSMVAAPDNWTRTNLETR